MKTLSLRFRITAISVAAILVAIFSIFAASASSIREETNRRSVETVRLIGKDAKNTLDEYFAGVEQSVWMAASMAVDALDSVTLVQCGAAGSAADPNGRTAEQTARLDAYIAEHCALVLRAFQSVANHTNGISAYYYCINPEISRSELGFFYSRVGRAGFVAQPPLNAGALDAGDWTHNAWYYTPIQRGRPCWVGPYSALPGDTWTCAYVVPIYSAGALIGVLGMDIPLATLVAQVSPIRVYETGFACLCDTEGRVLYHPTLAQFTVPQLSGLSMALDLLSEDSGDALIRYESGGEKRQMTFFTLRNGMKLVVTAPVKEINASWLRMVRVVAIISGAVIAVFAVVLMLAIRKVTTPLAQLTSASQRLADAYYDVALNYEGGDEIGKLTGAFSLMRDQIKTYIEDLNHRINTDMLTGLPNMRCFFRLARAERQRLLDAGQTPVLLYFDLIGMKHYNHQYGFEEGDRLLGCVARILENRYGEARLCRYSEDRFAVIAEEDGLEETLHSVFRDLEGANGGNSLPVRVGVYRYSLEPLSVSVACDRAKLACDRCGDSFVSGFRYFDEAMQAQLDNVRYVISHLDQALSEGWIRVYYQPIIRAVNGRVCDEEALTRWIDPEKGMLSPAEFIPILETARLIYKLDLYVLDQILEKMRLQTEAGTRLVPHSLNLSRADFDACDIVEEIRRRVDGAGIARDRLTIEVTESIIGSDFEFMKAQIQRLQALGFQVWMDDFGSGYSSLNVLQDIHFDLLKFDMQFMKRFGETRESKVILTDQIRMAIDLGVDTVCEGVETEEEAEFLREIGCNKLQGYFYCRPIPFEEILRRYRTGTQIGFENPAESDYYAAIGKVNLYDMTVIANTENARQDYFDVLPAGIVEIREGKLNYIRTNPAYRAFVKRFYGFEPGGDPPAEPPAPFLKLIRKSCAEGTRSLFDGKMEDGSSIHGIINPVGTNPATGAAAAAIAILSVTEMDKSATYGDIATALAADYYTIYTVNLDTDDYTEYSSRVGEEDMAVERRGVGFFETVRRESVTRVYEEDREAFLACFSKENIIRELNAQGVFSLTFRSVDSGAPLYVNMKITRMAGGRSIILGISIVDSQMQQKARQEELQKERDAMVRVMALSDGYLALYTVYPDTGRFIVYSSTEDYDSLGLVREGEDFFTQSVHSADQHLFPADIPGFRRHFSRESILGRIREKGKFQIQYRLMINGQPRPVTLKAALFMEGGEEKMAVGVRAWKKRESAPDSVFFSDEPF